MVEDHLEDACASRGFKTRLFCVGPTGLAWWLGEAAWNAGDGILTMGVRPVVCRSGGQLSHQLVSRDELQGKLTRNVV